jgi:sterol 3beta-glucosyltransferase
MGFADAFQGIVRHPYLGAKQEGFGGFGKGIGRAFGGFYCHSMAGVYSLFALRGYVLTQSAIFGLPGYFLKGIERGLLRRHLTTLQAEIVLIQLRRSSLAFRQATEAEKGQVVEKWNELRACMAKQ